MKNYSWLNFLVFICFLAIGYSYSTRFYAHGTSLLPDTPRVLTGNAASIETMPSGQRSLLLISTSAINTTSAQLDSIWLASYIPSEAIMRMIPVYPTTSGLATQFEDQLRQTFGLTRSNGSLIPDQAFFETLLAANYWWSGYFIFDEQAFSTFGNNVTLITSQGTTSLEAQESTDRLEILGNTIARSSAQLALLQSACQKFFNKGQDVSISRLLSPLAGHYLTDLDPELIQQEWDYLYSSKQNPSCKFPTLEISRLRP
jgi:hypothetical protein